MLVYKYSIPTRVWLGIWGVEGSFKDNVSTRLRYPIAVEGLPTTARLVFGDGGKWMMHCIRWLMAKRSI